jgi:YgiT-type zinc finger domain-containing protein
MRTDGAVAVRHSLQGQTKMTDHELLRQDTESGAAPIEQACSACAAGHLHQTVVRSAFWHHDRLVVVDDIPALVCDSCAEQLLDDRTAVRLDLLRGSGFPPEQARGQIQAFVFSLNDGV